MTIDVSSINPIVYREYEAPQLNNKIHLFVVFARPDEFYYKPFDVVIFNHSPNVKYITEATGFLIMNQNNEWIEISGMGFTGNKVFFDKETVELMCGRYVESQLKQTDVKVGIINNISDKDWELLMNE